MKLLFIMLLFLIMAVVVIHHGRYSQGQGNTIMTMKGVDIEREKKAFASFRFRPKGMVYMNNKFLCLKLKIFRRSKTD